MACHALCFRAERGLYLIGYLSTRFDIFVLTLILCAVADFDNKSANHSERVTILPLKHTCKQI
ncbi:unnamed protein product [Rhizopus stolonifer]